MLAFLYRCTVAVDRLLASELQRHDALNRARHAHALHGAAAFHHLHAKLADPRRRRSRRTIRLAIAAVIREESRATA